jgi:di/tricarboxylate transporter
VIGSSIRELEGSLNEYNINLVSLIHKKQKYSVAPKKHKLVSNDLLLLEGSQEDIDKLVSKHAMHLVGADSAREAILHSADTVVMEVVVPPNSRMEGRSVEQIRFKHYLGINLLAVSRQGRPFRGRLRRFTFKGGDVLLLHGEKEDVEEAITKLSCYPLAERKLDFGKRKFAIPALLIFITAIALAAFDILPIPVTLGCAVVAMVIGNIIPVRELYDGVDWPVVVLLGAMIPIGEALENTGATKLLADNLLLLSGGASLVVLLALVLVITMTLSDILNNAATAILMAPIAKNISEAVGVGPDPFLMAVAIGASCAFLTPIGHQNNALVLGPGGYQFGDYWRMGLPLEVLIVLVAIPMILIVWPFIPA